MRRAASLVNVLACHSACRGAREEHGNISGFFRITVHGVETTLAGYWQQQLSAKLGDVELPHEFLAVNLEKLSHSCERQVDGLVGIDFFRNRVVQIDFDAQKIRLLKPEKAKKSDETLPLQLRPRGIRVPTSVNGQKRQWVRLDTGCATALQCVTSGVKPDQCLHQMAIGLAEVSIPQIPCGASIKGMA